MSQLMENFLRNWFLFSHNDIAFVCSSARVAGNIGFQFYYKLYSCQRNLEAYRLVVSKLLAPFTKLFEN